MKYSLLILVFLLAGFISVAQTATPGTEVSTTIAKRISDSLQLTSQQQQNLFQINMQLFQLKQQLRTNWGDNVTELTPRIQAVERTRDSLYRPVLGEEKYILYLQKKQSLIRIN